MPLTLDPIWLPHWPACKWTISRIVIREDGDWEQLESRLTHAQVPTLMTAAQLYEKIRGCERHGATLQLHYVIVKAIFRSLACRNLRMRVYLDACIRYTCTVRTRGTVQYNRNIVHV